MRSFTPASPRTRYMKEEAGRLIEHAEKSSTSVQVFYPRFNKEEIIQLITKNLENLKKELPLLFVGLFGSYAKGNYTVASDVDLLVVYEGKEKRRPMP